MTGLCEDWVEDQLDGYASEEWTAAQVSRLDGELKEVLERWDSAARQFARLEDDPLIGAAGALGVRRRNHP